MDQQQDNSDYEALLQAGAQNQAYQAEMEKQKALAARLRSGPELEGQMVSGHYIAPNALEVIGDVMHKRRAVAADAAQTEATAGLGKSQASQNQMILARLLRAQQPQAPAPQPSPVTPAMANGAQQQGMSEY